MNLAFYASLERLPIGVAVTIEFLGPLTLATVLSRRAVTRGRGSSRTGRCPDLRGPHRPARGAELTGLALAAARRAPAGRHTSSWSGRTGRSSTSSTAWPSPWPWRSSWCCPGPPTLPLWTAGIVVTGFGIAMLSSVVLYSLELVALRRLSARVFGVLLSLEPAAAALAGFLSWTRGSRVSRPTGMVLVVLASALVMGAGQRKDPAQAASGLRTPQPRVAARLPQARNRVTPRMRTMAPRETERKHLRHGGRAHRR